MRSLAIIAILLCGCTPYDNLYNDLVAGTEGLFYNKEDGLSQLETVREDVTSAEEMIVWYREAGFEYADDPLWGYLDYASDPWVTILKNSGDCDDMALLNWYILHDRYDNSCIVVADDWFDGHSSFAYYSYSQWFYIDSMHGIYGPKESLADIAEAIFPGYSDFHVIYWD